jgi:hypothetical protein
MVHSRGVRMLMQCNEELLGGVQSGMLQKYCMMVFKSTLDKQLAPSITKAGLTHRTAGGEGSDGFAERGGDVLMERLQLKVKRLFDLVFQI